MENIIFNGRKIEYCLIRKNVKNINLRIKQDCSVIVSANPLVPKTIIAAFVSENAEKILAVIDKNNTKAALKPDFEKGSTVQLLGKLYTLEVIESSTNSYYVGENEITLYVNSSDKAENRQAAYNLLLKKNSRGCFPETVEGMLFSV